MLEEKKDYLSLYLLQEAKINRLNRLTLKFPDRRDEYFSEVTEAVHLRKEIEKKIRCIDSELLSEVLFQKYVYGKNLEEIAFNLNYSKRQLQRLHIKALEKFKL